MAKKTGLSELLDPGHSLTGKELRRVSRALTKIEIRPLLNAYARQAKRYNRDMRRDTRGLERLRRTTARQVRGVTKGTDRAMATAQRQVARQGAGLQSTIDQSQQQQQASLNQLQGSVLGDQINSLALQNIAPGGSPSQNALAQAAATQQAQQAPLNQSWDALMSTAASGANTAAAMQRAGSRRSGAAALIGVNRSIMDRKADTRNAYGEARREVLGKLADQKALRGPTMLKNLMELRDSERKYRNERLAIMQDRAEANAQNALDQQEQAENERHNRATENNDAKDGGGSGSDDTTYRDFFDAAQTIRDGNKITPTVDFFDKVASSEGVSLDPQQRRAWTRRYRRWLRKNGLIA